MASKVDEAPMEAVAMETVPMDAKENAPSASKDTAIDVPTEKAPEPPAKDEAPEAPDVKADAPPATKPEEASKPESPKAEPPKAEAAEAKPAEAKAEPKPAEAKSPEITPVKPTEAKSAEVTPVKPLRVSELTAISSPVSGAGSPNSKGNGALSKRFSFPGERSFSAAKSDEMSSSSDEGADEAACDLTTTNAQLERLLQSSAVELCLEVNGLGGRAGLLGARPLVTALFLPGSTPGTFTEFDRTEGVTDTRAVSRFVKKIRVPAATPQDREEDICIAVFFQGPAVLDLRDSIGACKITLDDLLSGPMMAMEVELANPKTGRKKGNVQIAADLVPHAERDEQLHFDFGFADDAPDRTRMLFILSRSIPKGLWSPVYRSEVKTRGELESFETVSISNSALNGGNDRRLLRLEVYRYYKNLTCTLLGFCQTSLMSLRTCPEKAGIYWWPAQDGITNAKLVLESRTADDDQSTFVLRVHNGSYKHITE